MNKKMNLEEQKRSLWNYLSSRGISNEKELHKALDEMKPVNIGLMVIGKDQLMNERGA